MQLIWRAFLILGKYFLFKGFPDGLSKRSEKMVAMSRIIVGEFIGNKVNCRKFYNSFQKCDETNVKFFIIFFHKEF
jgi:hypothetical protein